MNASGYLTDEQVDTLNDGTDPFYDTVKEYLGVDFREFGSGEVPDAPIIRDVQELVAHIRKGGE